MTASMPSTTPRQTTVHDSVSLACMAHVASRDSAASALFAYTVTKLPPCPVFERLEHVRGLGASHLADHYVIGPVAQSVPHQIAARQVAAGKPAGLEAQAIGPLQPQLQRIFDGDDAAVGRQERHQRVQQRRLAGAGAA